LAHGHEVTAVVRDPSRLAVAHSRLRVLRSEIVDPLSVEPAVNGADAVLSALGPHPRADDVTVCSRGIRVILLAMRATGVQRVVAVGTAMVPRRDPSEPVLVRGLLKPLMYRLFGRIYADLALMEAQLRNSSTEWTVFRPPLLTNRPPRGRYRTTPGRNAPGLRVSRADLADAMLCCLADAATVRTVVGIG
ncbi:MAG: NAD(P)H-binding protein, partial [Kutzneria sp.]|nr:NAD(P)H-binding protein [Kutzneria sp.]